LLPFSCPFRIRYAIWLRDIATKELRLLDNIGMAQMVQEIQKTVIGVTKRTQETMTEETGVESSLTEEDMKQYLEQVIKEVKGKATDNK
jgi:methyl coenzyme M reductase alpha subunit